MTTLLDIVRREAAQPVAGSQKIPWDDPKFSRRMLREHLSQAHDGASRRTQTIDDHVAWIREHLLPDGGARVLDLGCGPGLYTSRLATDGHSCVGIDYSPASIEYAKRSASENGLDCEYRQEDILASDFGEGFDLVMMLSGEFNTFDRDSRTKLARKALAALKPGGQLLLEMHPMDVVRRFGRRGPMWWSQEEGVFSDEPHIVLRGHAWDNDALIATSEFYSIEASTGAVHHYSEHLHAFSDEEVFRTLSDAKFAESRIDWSFPAAESDTKNEMMAVVARKGS